MWGEEREEQPCSICSQLRGVSPPVCLTPGALRCQPTVLDLHYDLWQLCSHDNPEETLRLAACLAKLCCVNVSTRCWRCSYSISTHLLSKGKKTLWVKWFCFRKQEDYIPLYRLIQDCLKTTYLTEPDLHLFYVNLGWENRESSTINCRNKKFLLDDFIVWLTFVVSDEIKMGESNTKTFIKGLQEHLYLCKTASNHLAKHTPIWSVVFDNDVLRLSQFSQSNLLRLANTPGRRPVVKHVQ